MLLVDMLILFTSTSLVLGVGWHTPSPVVFGQIGQNVTLSVRATGGNSAFNWYRQKQSGIIDMVCSGNMCSFPRHAAGMSHISGEAFLTILNASLIDSGSYFAASKLSKINAFRDVSSLNLAITDQIPLIRLFYGAGSTKTHVFQCEITGAGSGWSSPYWRVTENGKVTETKGGGGGGIDADGCFTRRSVVTLSSEKSFSITCLCRNNHTRVIIQTDAVHTSRGASLCLFISVLTPLACLLFLLTMVLAGLSARSIRKHKRSITIDG